MFQKIFIVLIAVVFLANILVWGTVYAHSKSHDLKVTFFNVGQGDSIFIEAPDGNQMLVDAGPNGGVLRDLSKEMSFFDRSVDVIVPTHPDADHIGGFLSVLSRYNVGVALVSGAHSDTNIDNELQDELKKDRVPILKATSGEVVDLGAGVVFEILSPAYDTSQMKTNNASIVGKLTYGNTSFLLTGDAPTSVEHYLVSRYGSKLESDVLKAGHHGSRTSSEEDFLRAVHPEDTIISVGETNRYGLPDEDVIDRIRELPSKILYTYDFPVGITFKSDGQSIYEVDRSS